MPYGAHNLPKGLSRVFQDTNVSGLRIYKLNPETGVREGTLVEFYATNDQSGFLNNKRSEVENLGFKVVSWDRNSWGFYKIKLYNKEADAKF